MTDEFRVVKSFLELHKVEIIHREDNGNPAIRFTNLKPGYGTAITIELDALPVEFGQIMNRLLVKFLGKANPPRGTSHDAEKPSQNASC